MFFLPLNYYYFYSLYFIFLYKKGFKMARSTPHFSQRGNSFTEFNVT